MATALEKLFLMQVVPIGQVDPASALGHHPLEAIEAQFEHLLIVDGEVAIAGVHVALDLHDVGGENALLLVREQPMRAVVDRQAVPEGADFMDRLLVFLTDREPCTGA